MTDKVQLIKEEIERQKSFCKKTFDVLHPDDLDAAIAYAHIELLDRLLQFIDSLPEEHASEDLEEEINNYIKDNFFGSGSMGFFSNRTKQELNSIDVAYIARHFAEWQKERDYLQYSHISLKDIKDAWQTLKKNKPDIESYPPICFVKGAEWQKQQMKEALQTEYEKGRFDMREEMMKDTVETTIVND